MVWVGLAQSLEGQDRLGRLVCLSQIKKNSLVDCLWLGNALLAFPGLSLPVCNAEVDFPASVILSRFCVIILSVPSHLLLVLFLWRTLIGAGVFPDLLFSPSVLWCHTFQSSRLGASGCLALSPAPPTPAQPPVLAEPL